MSAKFVVVFGAVILLASAAKSQGDVAALEVTFNETTRALNARDLDAALGQVDDGIVLFSLFSPFPMKGKRAFRQALRDYFASYESAKFAPTNSRFRVIGATGIAWGFYELSGKLQDGPMGYFNGRYLYTYTQAEGEWKLISMHFSPLEHRDMRLH